MKHDQRAPRGWDALALGASFACLVHCLGLPLLFAVAPALTEMVGLPDGIHLAAFVAAVPVSALAMRRGYRHHGLLAPALIGLAGLCLLGAGALGGLALSWETALTVPGSVLLAIAHLRNWSLQGRALRATAA